MIEQLMSRRGFVQTAAGAAGLMAAGPAALAASWPAEAAGKKGGTLTVAVAGDPKTLDVHRSTLDVLRHTVRSMVFESLIFVEPDLKIRPSLAESWTTSADGLTMTFKLRKGVQFHDGSDFTAQDVAFTIKRVQDPKIASQYAPQVATVKSVEVVDPHTVRLHLSGRPAQPLAGGRAGRRRGRPDRPADRRHPGHGAGHHRRGSRRPHRPDHLAGHRDPAELSDHPAGHRRRGDHGTIAGACHDRRGHRQHTGLRAALAQHRHTVARSRVCRGGAQRRGRRDSHSAPGGAAQYGRGADRHRQLQRGPGRDVRGDALLPRPGRPAAAAVVRRHAQRGQDLSQHPALVRAGSRRRPRPGHPRAEPARRRLQRLFRPWRTAMSTTTWTLRTPTSRRSTLTRRAIVAPTWTRSRLAASSTCSSTVCPSCATASTIPSGAPGGYSGGPYERRI